MSKQEILVVDDEEDIVELVKYNLEKDGFSVRTAGSGEECISQLRNKLPDLLLLDLMLPGIDGLDVCRTLKKEAQFQALPVIMLSAKGEEADIVAGLELGADDYIPKPFSPKVLSARVRSVLRRHSERAIPETEPVTREKLSLNPGRREVLVHDQKVELTNTEFKLLHLLMREPGWVFTRAQIVDRVHGEDYPVTDRSVDVQVVGLRRKLSEYGAYIETVRGVGYKFRA